MKSHTYIYIQIGCFVCSIHKPCFINIHGRQVPGEADGRACMVALRGQDASRFLDRFSDALVT